MSGRTSMGRASHRPFAALAATLLLLAGAYRLALADDPSTTASPATATKADGSAHSDQAQLDRIHKLIQQLGNPQFAARRSASNELRQIGAEAFDSLHAATEDTDPEIAASANYLLRQIAVRWVRPDDSATVRAILKPYGQDPEAARLQRVEQLASLPQNGGISALCRIARFDRSSIVSRTAATAIIWPKESTAARPTLEAATVEQQLGASGRVTAVWLRQYLAQQRDPAASVTKWKTLVDQESARLEKNGETSNEIVLNLEWNLAELYRQTGDQSAISGVLDRMLELSGDNSDETLIHLLKWLTKNQSWDVLDAFVKDHQSRILQSKRASYYLALARFKQGKTDVAEQLAATAAELHAQTGLDGFAAAKELEEHNHFEWAVREYRNVIDRQPADASETILSRIYLSNLLHDHEQEKDAAEVSEPLVKSVQGKGAVAELYNKIREYNSGRLGLPEPEGIAARYHFYRACQYQAEKDLTRAKQELDTAIKCDGTDVDVLIAMYHFPEGDAKWHESVKQRLRQQAQQFQQEIDQDPSDPTPYNQWAWLVSNTEGDVQKAIRYSHRSLELNANGDGGEASFMDTLGNCYFAAGDYENAVKFERQAIAKMDHLQIMHRQLAMFEKALAEKQASSKDADAKQK
ncbi:MAG TPA: tetratricopeptide repeat protein [Lacipirellulaceae bacterium]|nr:tetratricopeptide repeat protein [Lacipirellulaceae bacterium]